MKRLFLRVGALTGVIVILGLIAYAYGQRGFGEKYSPADLAVENASPLRGGAQTQSSSNNAVNPLRNVTLRAGPPDSNGPLPKGSGSALRSEPVPNADSRITKVAAEAEADSAAGPAADPFGLKSQKRQLPADQSAPDASVRDSIPDASEIDHQTIDNDQQNSQLAGSKLTGPAMVERYPAGGNSAVRSSSGRVADRYADQGSTDKGDGPIFVDTKIGPAPSNPGKPADRYGDRYANRASATDNREPAPFKADPFAAPTALSQNTDRRANRNSEPIAENPPADGFSNTDGAGQPGSKQIEGAQTPQVTIQKFAPNEIQVGKAAVFKITVRNTGSIPACQVKICDQVPRGTKLLGTSPRSSQTGRSGIVWTIGTLRPGEESSVEMQLMPEAEGEIGSVATVLFGADATARTISTRPKLALEMTAPEKVLIGEQAMLSITVSNPGTGVATGVVLEERIPQGLQHPAGAELEYEVGDLRPGESKKLDLPLAAVTAGKVLNVLTARADGNLHTEERLEFQVVAPKLDITLEGPKRRYLEREAVYQVSMTNPGTAAAQQVELVAYLPPGLKFLSANNAGHYDESHRAVHWRLEELPCNETGTVELVTMPVEPGQHNIKLRGTAERGLAVEKEQPVLVEGIASIMFQPVDVTGPIEVGGETTYEVHVINQGSKSASNVRLAVLLPPEMQPLTAEGPTRHAIDGNRIVFEGLARLDPKADANYRVKVKGIRAGDLRTRFQLMTDEMQSPVTKEESTRVYADE